MPPSPRGRSMRYLPATTSPTCGAGAVIRAYYNPMDACDGGGSAATNSSSALRPWDGIGAHARAAVIDPSSVMALSTGLVATAALSAGEGDHEARVFVL